MGNVSFVSVIIPCRNEEKFVGKCLDSIIQNEYPKDSIEVLVVDGLSDDRTREIVRHYSLRYPFIKLFDNAKKIVPSSLNIGIREASGEIIIRMDAHNEYEKDYIKKCVYYLEKYNADNVGGIWITRPGKETTVAGSIALALSHAFGVGNAYYRIGSKEPRYVDTVPFGCYKREIFDKIGLFDEELIRNQDDEFNLRLIKNGGRILLAPDIVSYYYARDSLNKLWKMYFQYGYFKPLVAKKIGKILTLRQLVPAIFVATLIFSLLMSFFMRPFLYFFAATFVIYLFVNLIFSFQIVYKNGIRYGILPLVFGTIHFAYGFGYLKGIADFLLLKKFRKQSMNDISLTR